MAERARALELLAMLLYAGAWLCILGATVSPRWLSMSTSLLPMESYELGLWETCVVQDTGGMECRAYDSLLGLSLDLQLGRVLTCASLAVGALGFLVAIPGLSLVNGCEDDGAKMTLSTAGGVLGMLSGVLCLIPVSYVAHSAVVRFFDDTLPDVVPRWEFGDALFCGWAGGFVLAVAGLLLVVTARSAVQAAPPPAAPQRRYQVMNTVLARAEYV
ncbi:claudin-22-like [Corythoichthys intestinalis]|uniref:claudin-22-like n=1 Tax=Corythoichthys intestinalis TaxID=161448 RepID=UPI0025A65C95|nr:claudin-22-like [Corythoichthys intestinalis]XP_061790796.1 claudin-22-like [Nerophis lumbriciformis]